MWLLSAVQVHVVDQGGLLREALAAQRAGVGLAGGPVHGHVPAQVGRVVELLATAGAGVQHVGRAAVDGQDVGGGEGQAAVVADHRPGDAAGRGPDHRHGLVPSACPFAGLHL